MYGEAKIVNEIMDFVNLNNYGKVIKVHGNPFMERGTPDLMGGIFVHMPTFPSNHSVLIPFAVEVKQPGETPTKIQEHRLYEWSRYGGFHTGWVTSLDQFKELVHTWALKSEYRAATRPEEFTWKPE